MPYGWMGVNLEVDLTRGSIQKVKGDPELVRAYLGGKGINARILWERVPPEVEPFSPDNLIIVSAGLLCGTPVPGANRTVMTYKSPYAPMHCWSAFGGFFAPELKYAGYDTIIIRGKSSTPVYLWINGDRVELRDASHLWGEGTHETQDLIREELENDKVQSACIGPAGENRAYAASVEHSTGASASRGGIGALWGDKKLKAIAVHGNKDVAVANFSRLMALCEQVLSRKEEVYKKAKVWPPTVAGSLFRLYHSGYYEMPNVEEEKIGIRKYMTAEYGQKLSNECLRRNKLREVACYSCEIACKWTFPVEGGGFSAFKCQSLPMILSALKMLDYDFSLKVYSLIEKYGFDSVSLMQQVAFAIDLYQKGILTKEDTDGMHLEYGNREVALALIEKIAYRQGIGDVLADGLYRAAQRIGRGAEQYVFHSNQQEHLSIDLRGRHKYIFEQAVNDKWDLTRLEGGGTGDFWQAPKEKREKLLKEGWLPYPKEYEKYLLADNMELHRSDDFLDEGFVRVEAYKEELYTLNDLMGICYFWGGWWEKSPYRNRAMVADIISSVTGMEIDEAEATRIARRTISLVRAHNVREGVGRNHDYNSVEDVYFEKSVRPPYLQADRKQFNKWLDRFYELKGQNKDGIPTRETLKELGLHDVVQELERRGMLTPPAPMFVSAT